MRCGSYEEAGILSWRGLALVTGVAIISVETGTL